MRGDSCARRIVGVVGGVALLLLAFYAFLLVQAYEWHPRVYAAQTTGTRSRVSLDLDATPWAPAATRGDGVARGRRLYRQMGCAVCHGLAGKGGVKSPNYERGTFPRLDDISQRMFLRDSYSYDEALDALRDGIGLDEDEDLDIEMARVVAAQYENVVNIISKGNPAQRKDPAGPLPLPMPGWSERLSPSQIRDVVAYLVSLQDRSVFEEEDEEE